MNSDFTKNNSDNYKIRLSELESMEDLYKQIFQASSSAIVIIKDGKIVFNNQRLNDITGFKETELNYSAFIELVHPEDKPVLRENFEHLLKNEPAEGSYTFRIIHKNEGIRWVQIKEEPIYFKKELSILLFIQDITEQKEAEEAVNTNLNFLNTLIDTIPIPLFYKNSKGIFIGCNSAFSECLGFEKEKIIGRSIYDIFPQPLADQFHLNNAELLNNKGSLKYDLIIPHADGTEHNVIVYAALFYQTDKTIAGVVGTMIDITSRIKTEKALQDNEQRYRLLADNTSDVIWVKNFSQKTIYVSPSVTNFLGYTVEEFLSKDLSDILTLKSYPKAKRILEEMIDKAKAHVDENLDYFETHEFRYIKKNKAKIWAEVKISFHYDQDKKPNGIYGIIRDISERKKTIRILKNEKRHAIEADKMKSAFVANMSHELRTPLNAILGFAELLVDSSSSESQKNEFINYIRNSGNSLLNLINDMIDTAKIEAGKLSLTHSQCRIDDLFSELSAYFELIKKRDNKEHIIIRMLHENNDNKLTIETDQFRLKQALTNLISNALKFTERGFVEVGYITGKSENSDLIKFYVKDTGIGMPKNKLNSIFDRFTLLEEISTRNYRGAGLGLSITKSIIEKLGGAIDVDSKPGEGTTFSFSIPCKIIRLKGDNHSLLYENTLFTINWQDKTILIAEDAEMNFILLKKMLEKTKIKILWARNGIEAVNMFKNNPLINVILMDMQMPKLDGYNATDQIMQINNKIPVIAQTAFVMEAEKERITKIGCVDFLSKPIDRNELIKKIANFIEYPG